MKCIYHEIDHDGRGSAALVKLAHPDCDLIGLDYDQPLPWDTFEPGETIVMVDFSVDTPQMARLNADYNFLWFDHHLTALMKAQTAGLQIKGLQDIQRASIELVWDYFWPEKERPLIVQYIGQWDRWDHTDPQTVYAHYGLRLANTDPRNTPLWRSLTSNTLGIVQEICDDGQKIKQFLDRDYAEYVKQAAFELTLPGGLRAICANRGLTGSPLLDSVYDPEKHDCFMLFYFQASTNAWRFSLYTDKDDVNLENFASLYGGGGHAKAAGFRSPTIPFDLPSVFKH